MLTDESREYLKKLLTEKINLYECKQIGFDHINEPVTSIFRMVNDDNLRLARKALKEIEDGESTL